MQYFFGINARKYFESSLAIIYKFLQFSHPYTANNFVLKNYNFIQILCSGIWFVYRFDIRLCPWHTAFFCCFQDLVCPVDVASSRTISYWWSLILWSLNISLRMCSGDIINPKSLFSPIVLYIGNYARHIFRKYFVALAPKSSITPSCVTLRNHTFLCNTTLMICYIIFFLCNSQVPCSALFWGWLRW